MPHRLVPALAAPRPRHSQYRRRIRSLPRHGPRSAVFVVSLLASLLVLIKNQKYIASGQGSQNCICARGLSPPTCTQSDGRSHVRCRGIATPNPSPILHVCARSRCRKLDLSRRQRNRMLMTEPMAWIWRLSTYAAADAEIAKGLVRSRKYAVLADPKLGAKTDAWMSSEFLVVHVAPCAGPMQDCAIPRRCPLGVHPILFPSCSACKFFL